MVRSLVLWGIPIVAPLAAFCVKSRRAAVRLCVGLLVLTLLTFASWGLAQRALGGMVVEEYNRLRDQQIRTGGHCPDDCENQCEAALTGLWKVSRVGFDDLSGRSWYFLSFAIAMAVLALRSPGRSGVTPGAAALGPDPQP